MSISSSPNVAQTIQSNSRLPSHDLENQNSHSSSSGSKNKSRFGPTKLIALSLIAGGASLFGLQSANSQRHRQFSMRDAGAASGIVDNNVKIRPFVDHARALLDTSTFINCTVLDSEPEIGPLSSFRDCFLGGTLKAGPNVQVSASEVGGDAVFGATSTMSSCKVTGNVLTGADSHVQNVQSHADMEIKALSKIGTLDGPTFLFKGGLSVGTNIDVESLDPAVLEPYFREEGNMRVVDYPIVIDMFAGSVRIEGTPVNIPPSPEFESPADVSSGDFGDDHTVVPGTPDSDQPPAVDTFPPGETPSYPHPSSPSLPSPSLPSPSFPSPEVQSPTMGTDSEGDTTPSVVVTGTVDLPDEGADAPDLDPSAAGDTPGGDILEDSSSPARVVAQAGITVGVAALAALV